MSRRVSEPGDATTGLGVRFRPPTPRDGRALWELAGAVGLDLNSPYAYVLWGDRFSASSIVAVADAGFAGAGTEGSGRDAGAGIVGFVAGFHPPDDPATIFVWQIGVAAPARGSGIGGRMLDELVSRTGARWLEATVTPSNGASAALFRSVGTRHDTSVEEELVYPADLFPDGHEPEVLFRIGPLDHDLSATQGT
ncbi:MAG TPA: diaminobutyrate acetyltransferase [Acidimicrobiales bacterium]